MRRYVKDGKKVVVVEDLGFLNDRHDYSWLGRELKHWRLRRALKDADVVLAESAQAAEELHRYYRVDAGVLTPGNPYGSQDPSQV